MPFASMFKIAETPSALSKIYSISYFFHGEDTQCNFFAITYAGMSEYIQSKR